MKDSSDKNNKDLSLESILNQLPGNIYWKSKDGTLLGCNKKNLQDFGLSSLESYIGKTDYALFPKDQASELMKIDNEVIHTGKTVITEEENSIHDGTKAIFLSYKSPLRDDNGEIIGVTGISLNVTEARQKEIKRLNLLEDVISLIPGHVYWKDKNGNYLGCNNDQAKALGLQKPQDIVNNIPYEHLTKEEAQALRDGDNAILIDGQTITLEEPGIRADGTTGTFLTKKTPLYDENKEIMGLLGVSFDITQRKKYEMALKIAKDEAEKAVVIKNEFIKNMEHDLRTPYSGVLSMTQMLWETEADPERKIVLGHVVESAKKLLDYHNGILDFSNILSGNMSIIAKKFNIKETLHTVYSIEKPAAAMASLSFEYHISDDMPDVVIGDEGRLSRILLNVIGNAIKFTKDGNVHMSAKLYKKEEKFVIIRIEIKDTGIGIPEAQQQYIFEKFSRLTLSNKGTYSGLGIGLNIVKEFVEDIGAEIDLVSKVNEGTNFILSIPYKLPLTNDILRA